MNFDQNPEHRDTNIDQISIRDVRTTNQIVAKYITGVYAWMFLALCITAITAYGLSQSTAAMQLLFSNKLVFMGLFLAQIFLVGYLAIRVEKMSSAQATIVFLGYSLLTGVTFSAIFLAYTSASIGLTFGVTAGTFGIMTAVGYFTKTDLTSFGKLLSMALVGFIIATIANWFLQSPMLHWIATYAGIAIFVGLIAYDTQKIKAYALLESAEARKKGAILGALSLYLDFINLFLMLLRVFGKRD